MTTPIKRGYEFIHEKMRQHLLDRILPSLFPTFVKSLKPLDAYPVVIGGTLIQRCAKQSAEAHRIIEDLLTEDIDMKVVVTRPIADNHDPVIPRIDAARHEFIHQVINKLDAYAKVISKENPDILVSVQESQKLLNIPLEFIARIRVLEIEVTYIEASKSTTLPILDLGLFTTFSVPEHYSMYMDFNKTVKLPVPYVSVNKILYATCNYAYFDTIRMLVDRAKYFEEKKTMYALMKFARYVVKFMCLYVLIEHKSIRDVDDDVRQVYEKAHDILKNINLDFQQQKTTTTESTKSIKQVGKMLKAIIRKIKLDDFITYLTTQHEKQGQAAGNGSRKTPFKLGVKQLHRMLLINGS